ncbi:hypothetical protein [Bacillus mycoides]|uniref:Virion structural protein n=1 Tax=Bacillus mycoides (strain KBAB4) TaxID=315730 RepID=A9VUY1_BACMK|nr:hypothetical protein [Bacillus mycoides]ABY46702.1 hypothetical protein BcerKBAB4_5753 [Bacillus mycoides KBAB4]PEK88269.1 hypothetical protein CN600_27330 [Bacillus mycoides]
MSDGAYTPAGKPKRGYANYYSGTDIRIYFGDNWIDEIVEIEWTMQEQLAPIYGYASYTWDKVARGNRLVQGSFSINFKEAGYLQTVLNSLSSEMKDENEWFSLAEFNGENGQSAHKNTKVEDLIGNFQALADDYENALWGTNSNSSKLIDSRKTDTFFYSTNENEKNKNLKEHGFNILLTYGNNPCAVRGAGSYKTVQTIVGVQLTGVSQRVDPSGNPISEVYTFIAKDISGNVQKAY